MPFDVDMIEIHLWINDAWSFIFVAVLCLLLFYI